ncbi:MAG: hypothetical protein AAF226_06050 [Verrucomicrobiota bacterium]
MKKLLFLLLALGMFADVASAYEEPPVLFCRERPKKKPFCLKFPNLANCLNACYPEPEVVGTIEWCRKGYTKHTVDDCGRPISYRAVDITYRNVLCNGGYGTCFVRTYREGNIQYQPTAPAKATYSSK